MAKKKSTAKKSAKRRAKKGASRKAPQAGTKLVKRARPKLSKEDRKTLKLVETTAERVRNSIERQVLPELKFPVRSLSNVKYEKKTGYFELGRGRKASSDTRCSGIRGSNRSARLVTISEWTRRFFVSA